MNGQEITVFYKWTAKPGRFDELKSIYETVGKEMEENEPETLAMNSYLDDENGALVVLDVFKNRQALGTHLGTTAASHFPSLSEIAIPGPFYFCGDVPAEMKQQIKTMNLGAEFSSHTFGFQRDAQEV